MKKALPHILYILAIVFLGVLSQINAAEADKLKTLAMENAQKAEQAAEDAMHAAADARRQEDLAHQQSLLAEEARMEAERLLKECNGK